MRLIKSFGYAIKGILHCIKNEQNFKLHIIASFAAIALAIVLHCTAMEWIFILLCIAMVMSLEMVNTAIERLCNMQQTSFHPQIKIIKDVAAGAVLISAIVAAICGLIIFLPKIILLFQTNSFN